MRRRLQYYFAPLSPEGWGYAKRTCLLCGACALWLLQVLPAWHRWCALVALGLIAALEGLRMWAWWRE